MTIPYYDDHGQLFFDRTVNIDLIPLYDTLAELIPQPAYILDAGCGSGRDSKVFLERGYTVSAFDASQKMVELATAYTGITVKHHTFADMTYDSQFDVVWAMASLLHLPRKRLPGVFENIIKALRKNGIFYCSFKVGRDERTADDGRHFTNFTEARMRDFVAQFPELLIERIFTTPDGRPGKPDWLNTYIRYPRK